MVLELAGEAGIILAFCLAPSVESCAQNVSEGQAAVGAHCDIAHPELDWMLWIGVCVATRFFLEADCEGDFGALAWRIGDVGVEETVALFDES
jgi:hypothetical protein